ncbi:MAG: hypothetical protein D6780_02040, partial [Candidatus Dadabacteria bacterium]
MSSKKGFIEKSFILLFFIFFCAATSYAFPDFSQANPLNDPYPNVKCGDPLPGRYIVVTPDEIKKGNSAQAAVFKSALQNSFGAKNVKFYKDLYGVASVKSPSYINAPLLLDGLKQQGVIKNFYPDKKVCINNTTYHSLSGSVLIKERAFPPVLIFGKDNNTFGYITTKFSADITAPISSAACSGADQIFSEVFLIDSPLSTELPFDGKVDLAALWQCKRTNRIRNTILFIFENKRNGVPAFKSMGIPLDLGVRANILPQNYLFKDVNGDGFPELVIASQDEETGYSIRIYDKLYEGRPDVNTVIPLAEKPDSVVAGDVNGDGLPELVVTTDIENSDRQKIVVYLNNGMNRFQIAQSITTASVSGLSKRIKLYDMDRDGKDDLVLIYADGNFSYIEILFSNENGLFDAENPFAAALTDITGNREITGLKIKDLDFDGFPDIIMSFRGLLANPESRLVRIDKNEESNLVAYTYDNQTKIVNITLFDYDNDGDLDIIAPSSRAPTQRYKNFYVEQSGANTGGSMLEIDTPWTVNMEYFKALQPEGVSLAQVQAVNLNTGRTYLSMTDEEGNFIFPALPEGNYQIVADKRLHKLVTSPNVTLNRDIKDVIVVMRNSPPVPLSLNGPLPSLYPNDEGASHQWALYNEGQLEGVDGIDMNVPEAWEAMGDNVSEVIVAVLDTGIDYRHPDLSDVMWRNPNEVPDNGVDEDADGLVDDYYGYNFANNTSDPLDWFEGHGTHVAGIIAAKSNNGYGISGVAKNVKLMAVKVLADSGAGSDSTILQGLSYVLTMKRRGVPVRVVNMSLGGSGECTEPYIRAFSALGDEGVFAVVAAGNEGQNNDVFPKAPANCRTLPNVVSVAALDNKGRLASFSNFGGSTVDFGAPGVKIWSTFPDKGFAPLDGTSMAAPQVAGVAALVLGAYPYLSPLELKARLHSTAKLLPQHTGRLITPGIVDAYQAIVAPFPQDNPDDGGGDSSGDTNPDNPLNPPTLDPPIISSAQLTVVQEKKNKYLVTLEHVLVTDPDDNVIQQVSMLVTVNGIEVSPVVPLSRIGDGSYKGSISVVVPKRALQKAKRKRKKKKKGGRRIKKPIFNVIIEALDNDGLTTSTTVSAKAKKKRR